MMQPVFILSTGRCGSTMLSEMLAECKQVLMLSEFLVSLSPGAFPRRPLDGREFWKLLSTPRLKYSTLIENNIAPKEMLYAHSLHRSAQDRVPPLLLVTLPFLSESPRELLDWLEPQIHDRPEMPVARHYAALFELLNAKLGRDFVIERSGGSLRFAAKLYRMFPEATFVHLFRNGPDCAQSMSRHPSFRLAALIERARPTLLVDPFHTDRRPEGPLAPGIKAILPESFDSDYVMNTNIDLAEFGRLWSVLVAHGVATLRRIPERQVISLRYEDLVADPEGMLGALAQRLGLPDGDWLQRAAAKPDRSRSSHPAAAESAGLRAACLVGMRLLGYH